MKINFQISSARLRVFSAVCSNLTAGWFAAVLLTRNPFILTFDIAAGIVSLILAIKTEEILDEF